MSRKKRKESKGKNIFEEIDLKIMLINEQIKNHQSSIEKAKRISGWQAPPSANGIHYSDEPRNCIHISFMEGLRMIEQDFNRISRLKAERAELRKSAKRIKKIYESLDGNEEQVYYLRVIRKMTQEEAAAKMNFSRRHFQRIEAEMKEKGLM